jgi:alpha-galactosidase/6-phospho-beta-glucosidase family protein
LLADLVFLPFPREKIEVTLVDINEKRLNYVERIARQIFAEKGVNEKNAGSITKCNT